MPVMADGSAIPPQGFGLNPSRSDNNRSTEVKRELNQESCNRLHRAPTGPPRFVTQAPAIAGFLLLNGSVVGSCCSHLCDSWFSPEASSDRRDASGGADRSKPNDEDHETQEDGLPPVLGGQASEGRNPQDACRDGEHQGA